MWIIDKTNDKGMKGEEDWDYDKRGGGLGLWWMSSLLSDMIGKNGRRSTYRYIKT